MRHFVAQRCIVTERTSETNMLLHERFCACEEENWQKEIIPSEEYVAALEMLRYGARHSGKSYGLRLKLH